jgi:hypothetical protein
MSNQAEMIDTILEALNREGILDRFVVVGSWCLYFYKHRFKESLTLLPWRTRDIEFDISGLRKASRRVDVVALFQSLDFVIQFSGQGYISFEHPELTVEFLVPEKGKGIEGPYELRGFGINAQPLRFLSLLEDTLITIDYHGLPVKVPHPAPFAIHKLIISSKRANKEKAHKDREQARAVWDMIMSLGEEKELAHVFFHLPRTWQKTMKKVLDELGQSERYRSLNRFA